VNEFGENTLTLEKGGKKGLELNLHFYNALYAYNQ
jgi:hypothetical protein